MEHMIIGTLCATLKSVMNPNIRDVMTNKLPTHPPQKTNAVSIARAVQPGFLTKHQTIINFWLDTGMLAVFIVLVAISVIVQFVFPPAEAAIGFTLFNMSLAHWMDVQFGTLVLFLVGVLLHVMLHWSWICGVVGSRIWRNRDGSKRRMDDGQRTILGVGLMIVLLNIMGVVIAIAAVSIRPPA